MKKMKRIIAILMCMFSLALTMTACSKQTVSVSNNQTNSEVVFTLNDYDVTLEEVYIYLIQYCYMYGINTNTLTEESKQNIIDTTMTEVKLETVEYLLANVTDGIEVSDEQLAKYQTSADEFYSKYGKDLFDSYGITKAKIDEVYEHQAYIESLEKKAKEDMSNDYYNDFQEQFAGVNFYTLYYVLFPSIKYESNGVAAKDEAGNNVLLSEDELATQKERCQELLDKAKANQEAGDLSGGLEALASEYGVDRTSDIMNGYDGAYSDELNALIKNLKVNEISDVVETEAGYMIVRMDNNDDSVKESILHFNATQKAEDNYANMQNNWVSASGVNSATINQDALNSIDILALYNSVSQHF